MYESLVGSQPDQEVHDIIPATKHRPQTASNHGRDPARHAQSAKLGRPQTATFKPEGGKHPTGSFFNRPLSAAFGSSTIPASPYTDQQPDQAWQQHERPQEQRQQQQQKSSLTALSRLKDELQQLTSRHNVQLQCLNTTGHPGPSSRPASAACSSSGRTKPVSKEVLATSICCCCAACL